MPMPETPEREHEARALIDALPQRAHIPEERIDAWIGAVSEAEPERLVWHARRLGGIGGSEIGVLLTEAQGGRDPWQTAREIALGKLLLRAPEPSTPAMRRGTVLEAVARALFLSGFGVRPMVLDPEVMIHSDRPWMRGNPDEVVGNGSDPRPIIVDYKVPGAVEEDAQHEVMARYGAQLHYYRAILASHDQRFTDARLVLARLDIDAGDAIARLVEASPAMAEAIISAAHQVGAANTDEGGIPGFRIVASEIDFDPDLDRAIAEVGAAFWEGVVAGRLPPWPKSAPRAVLEPEAAARFERESERLARADAIGRAAETLGGAARERLRDLLEGVDLKTQRSPSALVTAMYRESVDPDRTLAALQARGVDTTHVRGREYDAEAMAEALSGLGVDLAPFLRPGRVNTKALMDLLNEDERAGLVTREVQVRLTGARKGAGAEALAHLRETATAEVAALIDRDVPRAPAWSTTLVEENSGPKPEAKAGEGCEPAPAAEAPAPSAPVPSPPPARSPRARATHASDWGPLL